MYFFSFELQIHKEIHRQVEIYLLLLQQFHVKTIFQNKNNCFGIDARFISEKVSTNLINQFLNLCAKASQNILRFYLTRTSKPLYLVLITKINPKVSGKLVVMRTFFFHEKHKMEENGDSGNKQQLSDNYCMPKSTFLPFRVKGLINKTYVPYLSIPLGRTLQNQSVADVLQNMLLKISQFSQENTRVGVSF